MRKLHVILMLMACCLILVPVSAYALGGWYAYVGHAVLSIAFAGLAVLLKTRYYWEED